MWFLSGLEFLSSRPFSDQGKCATGMMKKLGERQGLAELTIEIGRDAPQNTTTGRTYLFEVSAIPANALYQASNAASIPKTPPAMVSWGCTSPFGPCLMKEMARQRKARSKVKKSEKKATVDFRVQMSRIVVKMNQP
jgi:hypothetical protein